MNHSPRGHLDGRKPFPQVPSNLPQEHVEMVMLALLTKLDQCTPCTEQQVSWIASDPERMLSLHELLRLFAGRLGFEGFERAPEWAALELAIVSRPEREAMVDRSLMLLGNMLGRVLGYIPDADSM